MDDLFLIFNGPVNVGEVITGIPDGYECVCRYKEEAQFKKSEHDWFTLYFLPGSIDLEPWEQVDIPFPEENWYIVMVHLPERNAADLLKFMPYFQVPPDTYIDNDRGLNVLFSEFRDYYTAHPDWDWCNAETLP